MKISDRLKHAWDAFRSDGRPLWSYGTPYSYRPDRLRLTIQNERSIIASIYNRIAIDVSALKVTHARQDENGRYVEDIKDNLYDRLTMDPNLDQTAGAFFQDVVMSMLDEGVIAIVPVRMKFSPAITETYVIDELRVGKILQWYPEHVQVRCYNQKTGLQEDFMMPKRVVAIIENPFYAVMNETNSTLRRLIMKLNMLDAIDKQSSSGKLDLIIQLPYVIKDETRAKRAEARRQSIETQLAGSQYGIAYIDGTERVTQLNRPSENNLLAQIEYLTKMLYNQLGTSEEVFAGTADEQAMLNYNNRTIEPIISAICDEMTRKFLTKTARTQGQVVTFLRDPFRLVPVANIAEIADKFTRNEILSSNDIRSIIGYRPSKDPRADELRNKNLNANNDQLPVKLDNDSEEKIENAS